MPRDVELLRACLQRRCGGCLQGWRRFFDTEGLGRIDAEAFAAGCRKVGFVADVEALYAVLADTHGFVEFDALDSETADLLNEFASFIQTHFGTVSVAFRSCIPRNHHKDRELRVTFKAFMHACLEMGFSGGSYRRLFDCIDVAGTGEVSWEQLAVLERWKADVATLEPPGAEPGEALRELIFARAPIADIIVEAREESFAGQLPAADLGAALLQAADRGLEGELRELLTLRADPNFADGTGVSALHRAAARGQELVDATLLVQLLCASAAEVNVRTRAGATPLHAAVAAGRSMSTATLIYMSADANLRDAQNRSPLDIAVMKGDAACARQLLGALADPCCAARGSCSAIELAEQHHQTEIVGLLREQACNRTLELLPKALDDLLEKPLPRTTAVREAEDMVSRYLLRARLEPSRLAATLRTWQETLPEGDSGQGTIDNIIVSCLRLCINHKAACRDLTPAEFASECSWQSPSRASRRSHSATRLRMGV